jgi:hypothetical protein
MGSASLLWRFECSGRVEHARTLARSTQALKSAERTTLSRGRESLYIARRRLTDLALGVRPAGTPRWRLPAR